MGACQVSCCAKDDLAYKNAKQSEINVHEAPSSEPQKSQPTNPSHKINQKRDKFVEDHIPETPQKPKQETIPTLRIEEKQKEAPKI